MSVVKDCREALERLLKGEPKRVKPGYKIKLDTVAREAGHKPGSIKASRASHADLHRDVLLAASNRQTPLSKSKLQLTKQKQKFLSCEEKLQAAYKREILMVDRIYELEKQLNSEKK